MDANDSNQKTLDAYEEHVNEYINNGTPQTVDGVVKVWLDEATASLPADARILELGSAFGRDAMYLQGKGFSGVICSDATKAFVALLQEQGLNARVLNAINDDLGGPYDLIFANAVLLHFTPEELKQVLKNVHDALAPGGKFAFTVKQGKGEEWSDAKLGAPRYFRYWTEETLRPRVVEAGFGEISIKADANTSRATWVQVIARKQ